MYYRCTRDLLHYRHKGNIYNFRMGNIVPYTEIVQNNLQNFEAFGTGEELSTKTETVKVKKEILIEPKAVPKSKKKPAREVEVYLEVDDFQVPLEDITK